MFKCTAIATAVLYMVGMLAAKASGDCIVDYMWAASLIVLIVAFLPRTRDLRHRLLPAALLVSVVTFVLSVTV